MKNRIITIGKKILVGKHLEMSYKNDKTRELWQSFMPQRSKIHNRVDALYYSMQIYPERMDYKTFAPLTSFTKWAAVEVSNLNTLPNEMDSYILEGGTYTVFTHIGPASTFAKSMHYIHEIWLPKSEYVIDDREHFELLQEDYNPMDEYATEEIWIPVKLKKRIKKNG